MMNWITPEEVKAAAKRIGWVLQYQVYHYVDPLHGHCGCPQSILYFDSHPNAQVTQRPEEPVSVDNAFMDLVCDWVDQEYGKEYGDGFRHGFDNWKDSWLFLKDSDGYKLGKADGQKCRQELLETKT